MITLITSKMWFCHFVLRRMSQGFFWSHFFCLKNWCSCCFSFTFLRYLSHLFPRARLPSCPWWLIFVEFFYRNISQLHMSISSPTWQLSIKIKMRFKKEHLRKGQAQTRRVLAVAVFGNHHTWLLRFYLKMDEMAFKESEWRSADTLMKYVLYTKEILLLHRSDKAISAVHFSTGCLM